MVIGEQRVDQPMLILLTKAVLTVSASSGHNEILFRVLETSQDSLEPSCRYRINPVPVMKANQYVRDDFG